MLENARKQDSRGAVLILAILLLTLLATLGVGLLSASLTENVVSRNDVNVQRALEVAQAGIAHARQVIGANLSTTSLTSRLTGATTTAPEVALAGVTNQEGLGTGNGRYSAWISNNLTAYNKSPGYAADAAPGSDTDSLIWIRSVGTFRNATQTVRVLADFSSGEVLDPPGAVTLIDGAGSLGANFSGNAFGITGNDTAAPTTSGACGTPGASKYGISVNSSAALTALGAAVASNQEDNITGSSNPNPGEGSYANNGTITAAEIQRFADRLLPLATAIPGGPNSSNYGCPAPTAGPPACPGPGLFKATSDVKLNGNGNGYGILIATADFEMAGNYKWEGLIVVVGAGYAHITGADSKVYGAILIANTQGGQTYFDQRGNGGAYYSSQAICRVKNANLIPYSTMIAWQQVD